MGITGRGVSEAPDGRDRHLSPIAALFGDPARSASPVRSLRELRSATDLLEARTCYDHSFAAPNPKTILELNRLLQSGAETSITLPGEGGTAQLAPSLQT
jgi:hypothetical protein